MIGAAFLALGLLTAGAIIALVTVALAAVDAGAHERTVR